MFRIGYSSDAGMLDHDVAARQLLDGEAVVFPPENGYPACFILQHRPQLRRCEARHPEVLSRRLAGFPRGADHQVAALQRLIERVDGDDLFEHVPRMRGHGLRKIAQPARPHSQRSLKPKFFIARQTEPTLPSEPGSTRIMRTFRSLSSRTSTSAQSSSASFSSAFSSIIPQGPSFY